MLIRVRLAGPVSSRADQAAFTALTPVEGIVHVEIARGAIAVAHDGRVTAEQLRAALAVAGLEIAEIAEERRRLPTV